MVRAFVPSMCSLIESCFFHRQKWEEHFSLREGVWSESTRFFNLKKMKAFGVFLEWTENGAQWPTDLFERLRQCKVSNESIFRDTSGIDFLFLLFIIEVYSMNRSPREADLLPIISEFPTYGYRDGFYFYVDLAVSRSLNVLQRGSIRCFVLRIGFLVSEKLNTKLWWHDLEVVLWLVNEDREIFSARFALSVFDDNEADGCRRSDQRNLLNIFNKCSLWKKKMSTISEENDDSARICREVVLWSEICLINPDFGVIVLGNELRWSTVLRTKDSLCYGMLEKIFE